MQTLDLVADSITVAGREVRLLRPRDSESLLDEEAFEREEFLPYWAELWPSGIALARAVADLPLAGARVLELGCGLALPSIAAALGGAVVTAADWSPHAVALAARNAERNGVAVRAVAASWASPAFLFDRGPWDLVLAADVLYERRDVPLLLELLPRLVAADGSVLLADPGRPPAAAFLERAAATWTLETLARTDAPRVTLYRLARRGRARPGAGASRRSRAT